MPDFLFVDHRKYHRDYDTPADHVSFRVQWDIAGERALREPARNVIDVIMEVVGMHRAWNGPWCVAPAQHTVDNQPGFLIDEANALYRCVVCGTAWHILTPDTLSETP